MQPTGHGKIFAATYTGSMYGHRDLLTLWPYVIANTGADHTVELNPQVISGSLGWDKEEITAAIDKLCSPDPNSRSDEHDGRRLLPRGGFMYLVVTHERYGMIKNEEERKAYFAAKQRESRERRKGEGEESAAPERKAEPDPNTYDNGRMPAISGVQMIEEKEAVDQAAFKGCDPLYAREIYRDWKSRGGRDAGGVPVEWLLYICKRWDREREQWLHGTHHLKTRQQNGNGGGTQNIPLGLQLKAIEEQISRSPANPNSTFYNQKPTDLEKAAFTALKRKRNEITSQIANAAVNNNSQ